MCLECCRTEDKFRFPCGHAVCGACDAHMTRRGFLACPTCRTPREGVSQLEVDASNNARVLRENQAEERAAPGMMGVYAGGRAYEVLFFPDESDGNDPFRVLGLESRAENVPLTPEQEALLRAAEAMVEAEVEHHAEGMRVPLSRRPSEALRGPMRDLVDSLLRPTTIPEFLAQRETVRRERRTAPAR